MRLVGSVKGSVKAQRTENTTRVFLLLKRWGQRARISFVERVSHNSELLCFSHVP